MPLSRREIWAERMARYRASSLTVKEFCLREGVSAPNFYQWKKKLGDTSASASPAFVPVSFSNQASSTVTLTLPGGATIELSDQLDQSSLQRIVGAVVAATMQVNAP